MHTFVEAEYTHVRKVVGCTCALALTLRAITGGLSRWTEMQSILTPSAPQASCRCCKTAGAAAVIKLILPSGRPLSRWKGLERCGQTLTAIKVLAQADGLGSAACAPGCQLVLLESENKEHVSWQGLSWLVFRQAASPAVLRVP